MSPTEEDDLQVEEPRGKANGGMEYEHGQGLSNLRGGQLERQDPRPSLNTCHWPSPSESL